MYDHVIIGGGFAGLSAANRFVDMGIRPTLLEAENYPRHRVCGEFFSSECISFLERWDFPVSQPVRRARFIASDHSIEFQFPEPAWGLSRYRSDAFLADRARSLGADIRSNTAVLSIEQEGQTGTYRLDLSTGESIQARQIIMAVGRHSSITQTYWKPVPDGPAGYLGLKMHFRNISMEDLVEMHFLPQAYFGLSSIEDGKTNVACIVKRQAVQAVGSPEAFISALAGLPEAAALTERLSTGENCFEKWMTCGIPGLGILKTPLWPNVYFIGDCAGIISPVTGDGLSLATQSGVLAAEFASEGNWEGFRSQWNRNHVRQFRWAVTLHKVMINFRTAQFGLSLARLFKRLPLRMFHLTRAR